MDAIWFIIFAILSQPAALTQCYGFILTNWSLAYQFLSIICSCCCCYCLYQMKLLYLTSRIMLNNFVFHDNTKNGEQKTLWNSAQNSMKFYWRVNGWFNLYWYQDWYSKYQITNAKAPILSHSRLMAIKLQNIHGILFLSAEKLHLN